MLSFLTAMNFPWEQYLHWCDVTVLEVYSMHVFCFKFYYNFFKFWLHENRNKNLILKSYLACLSFSCKIFCDASICLTSSTKPYCTSSLTSSMPGLYVLFSSLVCANFITGSLSLIAFSSFSMSSSSCAISFSVLD